MKSEAKSKTQARRQCSTNTRDSCGQCIISLICDKSVTNSKFVIFQEKVVKVLKCYNFLWVQRRHNCSPATSFANCVMTLHLLKVHLQTFLSIPITQKCQILSCNTLVTNERYVHSNTILWLKNTICLFTPGRSKWCSFLQTRPDGLWGPPNPMCNEYRSCPERNGG
jgi:hypothetical protein